MDDASAQTAASLPSEQVGPERGAAGGGAATDPAPQRAVTVDGHAPDVGVDPTLLQRARGLSSVPLAERAKAFDDLNRDVVAALRAIEEV